MQQILDFDGDIMIVSTIIEIYKTAMKPQCTQSYCSERASKEWTTGGTQEESDRMQLLNGTWNFQYYNSIYDIQNLFLRRIMIQKTLTRFRFRVYGRWQDMTHTSIQTSGIRSHLIHRMYHRISRVEHMHILLTIIKMKMHQSIFKF